MAQEEANNLYLEDRTAAAYLTQARRFFFNCGDSRQIYGSWREPADISVNDRMAKHLRAQDRQLDWARTSILFAALASEAYINGFLAERLDSTADFRAIEKLRTLDKYVIGTKLAVGKALFDRGAEPGQTLGALFTLRHALVHPKMRPVKVDKGTLVDERFADFNTEAAARFLVAVADAATTLYEHANRQKDAILDSILAERERFISLGIALRDGLPAPPKAAPPGKGRGWLLELGDTLRRDQATHEDMREPATTRGAASTASTAPEGSVAATGDSAAETGADARLLDQAAGNRHGPAGVWRDGRRLGLTGRSAALVRSRSHRRCSGVFVAVCRLGCEGVSADKRAMLLLRMSFVEASIVEGAADL